VIFGKLQKLSKSLEKLPCSVYTVYVDMNGNEVLPRLFVETAFADDFCFLNRGIGFFYAMFFVRKF